jgi:hypothetical protein
MGTQAWFYVVPSEENLLDALDKLREREFRAGRYFPARWELEFSLGDGTTPQAPTTDSVPAHASIEEARKAAAEDGTKSILDVDRISETADWGAASPVDDDDLESCFGSTTPERETLGEGFPFLLETLGRGEARYLLLYEHGAPAAIVFVGLSYD